LEISLFPNSEKINLNVEQLDVFYCSGGVNLSDAGRPQDTKDHQQSPGKDRWTGKPRNGEWAAKAKWNNPE
jgi:hypothetical protein